MEKEENEKKYVCRVLDLEHSANRFTVPHTHSSLWFKNKKNKIGLSSAHDLVLGKPWLCRVLDRGHLANLHRTQPRPHTHAHAASRWPRVGATLVPAAGFPRLAPGLPRLAPARLG